MTFNSLSFLIFLPVVIFIFFQLPHRFRWLHLLIASVVFYMAYVPVYILILALTILVDYFSGIWIERSSGLRRKGFLAASLIANGSVLFFFKYFNFFTGNVDTVFTWLGIPIQMPALHIILPIGLSFHTFQAMSYTIEVYRGKQKAETHLGLLSVYVLFFPQLVAGPIERPQHLLHQFKQEHFFDAGNFIVGLRLILRGMLKKVLIADQMALYVNEAYAKPAGTEPIVLLVATLFFAVQIYCDFSGYSDIAIGSARIMGFRLMQNFRQPYFARNLQDFWRRWHISLSTWFRDYLYYPLGGSRVSRLRMQINLFIVFLLSGFWHGANWTFIMWGLLHGTGLVIINFVGPGFRKALEAVGVNRVPYLYRAITTLITFAWVTLTWVFFRAENVSDAFLILRRILTETAITPDFVTWCGSYFATLAAGCLVLVVGMDLLDETRDRKGIIVQIPAVIRWGAYMGAALAIMNFGVIEVIPFIYFQF